MTYNTPIGMCEWHALRAKKDGSVQVTATHPQLPRSVIHSPPGGSREGHESFALSSLTDNNDHTSTQLSICFYPHSHSPPPCIGAASPRRARDGGHTRLSTLLFHSPNMCMRKPSKVHNLVHHSLCNSPSRDTVQCVSHHPLRSPSPRWLGLTLPKPSRLSLVVSLSRLGPFSRCA